MQSLFLDIFHDMTVWRIYKLFPYFSSYLRSVTALEEQIHGWFSAGLHSDLMDAARTVTLYADAACTSAVRSLRPPDSQLPTYGRGWAKRNFYLCREDFMGRHAS